MSFLIKLDKLMKDKNINKNQLSKESGVPYTTIDGFYKKGTENIKLSTLKKLSSYFGCSLDYLADDDISENAISSDSGNWEPSLSDKEEKDLDKKVENLLGAVDSDTGLMLDGEIMDEETREIFAMNLKNALKTTKLAAKAKYTPNKYRK
ncbi:MAG: helix-turn-helix transcriptional regulator [Dialister sp.]|uniref:helix-turn-helix domain-containing protein n=1 Tax=Dialister sp. TaxID=1955814 RepID=UPI0025807990|nr:helix-turn-helix transcriptional regulator [Dialister sp.]MBS6295946.1 helix-turn-helix transcriptional regulator [Dialister sp.]